MLQTGGLEAATGGLADDGVFGGGGLDVGGAGLTVGLTGTTGFSVFSSTGGHTLFSNLTVEGAAVVTAEGSSAPFLLPFSPLLLSHIFLSDEMDPVECDVVFLILAYRKTRIFNTI